MNYIIYWEEFRIPIRIQYNTPITDIIQILTEKDRIL